MKRSYLKRKTPLRRTDGFKRNHEMAREFSIQVVGGSSRCIMQGRSRVHCSGPFDACHLISKRALRSRGFPEAVVYDPRNGVCACRRHHYRNDNAVEPFPWELITTRARSFAYDHGLFWMLEGIYRGDDGGRS